LSFWAAAALGAGLAAGESDFFELLLQPIKGNAITATRIRGIIFFITYPKRRMEIHQGTSFADACGLVFAFARRRRRNNAKQDVLNRRICQLRVKKTYLGGKRF
jgi:hypothetical protein